MNLARLIFGCNDIPQHPKGGYAWDRRWIIIDFPMRFEGISEDKSLDTKLQTPAELSGFLNLCLKALHWLLETKTFFYDKTPEQVGEEYLLKSNSVMAFMKDCTNPADDYVRTTDLYQAYITWAKAKKLKKIEAPNILGRLLKNGGFTQNRPYIDGKQCYTYEGFVINYEKLASIEKTTQLKNNQEAYTHWYTKDNTFKLDKLGCVIDNIIQICTIHPNISNIELSHTIYLDTNPTYPTQTSNFQEKTTIIDSSKKSEFTKEDASPSQSSTLTSRINVGLSRDICDICGNPLNGETCRGLPGQGKIHTKCKFEPITVRFLTSIPNFIGIDNMQYGPFQPDMTATLPAIQALAFVTKHAAEKVI